MALKREFRFTTLLCVILQVPVLVCKNAEISSSANSSLVGSSVTLTCQYIGKGNETAIYWYNGSNSDMLTLLPDPIVPICDVFSIVNTTFDPQRIRYSCDARNDIYSLTIDRLMILDNNVTWSCTFLDPAPNRIKAEIIIYVSGPSNNSGEGQRSTNLQTITYVIVSIIVIVIIAFSVVAYKRLRSQKKKIIGHQESLIIRENQYKPISTQQEHVEEADTV